MKSLILVLAFVLTSTSALAGTFYGEASVDIYDGFGNFMDSEKVSYTGETFPRKKRLIGALDFQTYGPTLVSLKRSGGSIIFKGQKFKARTATYKGRLIMGVYKYVRSNETDPANSLDASNTRLERPNWKKVLVAILIFKDFDGTSEVDPTLLNDSEINSVLSNY